MLRTFIWTLYDNLGAVVVFNLLWSLCSLPWLLTAALMIGMGINLQEAWGGQALIVSLILAVEWVLLAPPTLLLFWGASRWVRNESYEVRDLFVVGRRLFWRSQLTALLLIAITLVLLINFFFYQQWGGFGGLVLSGAMLWFLLGLLFAMIYVFPVLIAQELSVWRTVQQSLMLSLDNFKLSCGLILGFIIALGVSVLMIIPLFVGALAGVAIWICLGFHFISAKYTGTVIEPQEPRGWREVLRPWEN